MGLLINLYACEELGACKNGTFFYYLAAVNLKKLNAENVTSLLNVSLYLSYLLVLVCRLALGFPHKIEADGNEW